MHKTRIEWAVIGLDAILQNYADGFKPKNGTIITREWFVDTVAKKVVFKLFVQEKDK